MKTKLGLDIGSNSIGWALVRQERDFTEGEILGMGSRIIPMSQDILGEFGKGNSVSQTAERTFYRSTRRLRERHLLRRERLHRVLNILGFLPEHYVSEIDFEKRLGQFRKDCEPKIAYNAKGFLFKDSFNEMVEDFKKIHPDMDLDKKKIPYDWTIYYLRKKALTRIIEREELAWLILHFNQKRGYYQQRGEEEEENSNKKIEFHSLQVIDVKEEEVRKGKAERWYSLELENGWIYRRSSKNTLFDWKYKVMDFVVTTDLNEDGTEKIDKEGNVKRSFRAPKEDDWTLIKKKTEQEIERSDKTVGAYIYDSILTNPRQKVRGKLIRTIERQLYKDELLSILKAQSEFHPELKDEGLFELAIWELYRNNPAHQRNLENKGFIHLFVNDIIFYHRPLKSKKSTIGRCSLEYRKYINSEGVEKIDYLRGIPKSHPLFQEFRLWQWVSNLKIYTKDGDKDVTGLFLKREEDIVALFDHLNERQEIDQNQLLKYFKVNSKKYRWNFVVDKKYPCNSTGSMIKSRLAKVKGITNDFLTPEKERQLWHLIFSVTDKKEYERALLTFAKKNELDEQSFTANFRKFPPFKSEYGSFSEKAIKRLLPLMRHGKYWKWDNIDPNTQKRIENILNGEVDFEIKERVREFSKSFRTESDFKGLPLWLASYVVYDRHAEGVNIDRWNSIDDLEKYIQEFKQHSLRNPIVEQVVVETLRVVKDIWAQYGNGKAGFFDEIHVELGRDMKNTAESRKRITNKITENENTNLRIKAFLAELVNDPNVQNVRPYSPMQQEILKIYEDGVINSGIEIPEEMEKISKLSQPSSSQFQRYKLWLEQKYRSPYTGAIIPLNKLFTPEFEIEHVIPQSRYFDDGFNNKVICEAAVNKLKDHQLGLEFIKNHHGQIVDTGFGKSVKIFDEESYKEFVSENYVNSLAKKNKLLLEEIPDKMIERQLNDTRFISKFVTSVLSNIVRSEDKDDGVNSKNVIPVTGAITSRLKNDWGLNDVWNELILPRFERMNTITNSNNFTSWNERHQKYLPTIPVDLSKGFSKKRIDHRHHALDALVVACTTRDHVNLLNNKHAKSTERFDLNRKLRNYRRVEITDRKSGELKAKEVPAEFKKPWPTLTSDAKHSLERVVVSFKQNLRVINKTTNKYQKIVSKNGTAVKALIPQTSGDSWAIRKSLHKDTVYGSVKLKKTKNVALSIALDQVNDIVDKGLKKYIKSLHNGGFDKKKLIAHFKENDFKWNDIDVARPEIFYWEVDQNGNGLNVASRVLLDTSFNEKRIKSITDTGIQKILINHLKSYEGRSEKPEELAFAPEGIEEMNKNIVRLNNGKFHQPIYKVRTYEPQGSKFQVGNSGNKDKKFVEAAKGTNLFFAVYQNEDGKRKYDTIPLNEVIEHQKWRASLNAEEQKKVPMIPLKPELGEFLFHLSPNDLVYVSKDGENATMVDLRGTNFKNKIYRVVSFTGNRAFFVQHRVASSIVNKQEFSSLNKMERCIDGIMIKECCQKIRVDRVGNIFAATA